MKKLILIIAPILLFSGCLEFEEQKIVWLHNTKSDELNILLIYKGLYEGGTPFGGDGKKGENQLKEIMSSDWQVTFLSWWGEITKKGILDAVSKELNNPPSARKELCSFIFYNWLVTNGKFFYDSKKKLSGYQFLKIKNISKFVDLLNNFISEELLSEEKLSKLIEDAKWSKETKKLIANAVKTKHKWLCLDGNIIKFAFPITSDDFGKAKKEILHNIFDYSDKQKEFAVSIIADNNFGISYDENVLTITIGNKKSSQMSWYNDNNYSNNLVDFVKEKWGISYSVKEEELISGFLQNKELGK